MVDLWNLLIYVGLFRVVYLILRSIYFNYFCKINIELYKYGWVVITGASDGIGKALSIDLAAKGFKLVLISRNEDKLIRVVKEIRTTTSNNNIEYVVSDFKYSHRDPIEFYSSLMKKLEKYEISCLINNVGIHQIRLLAEHPLDSIEEHFGVNIYPQTMLSYYILPKFIERFEKTKQRSLLINFSSMGDMLLIPALSVYTSTKRYNDFLSEGIRLEYSHAVDVATVKPGVVETNMTKPGVGNGLCILPLTVEANAYAKSLFKNLHKGINYGHWKHSLLALLVSIPPYQLLNFLLKHSIPLFEYFKVIRHD